MKPLEIEVIKEDCTKIYSEKYDEFFEDAETMLNDCADWEDFEFELEEVYRCETIKLQLNSHRFTDCIIARLVDELSCETWTDDEYRKVLPHIDELQNDVEVAVREFNTAQKSEIYGYGKGSPVTLEELLNESKEEKI